MKLTNLKNLPNCLRKYRLAKGLTQREVAKILGLKSSSMISRWENSVCLPESLNMFKLAMIYRTMVDALFIDLSRALKVEILKREMKFFKKGGAIN
jgi:transcriptional regulator with XRE-family HTH domain